MPVSLACLMAATAALLAVAVCGVLWRKKGDQPSPAVLREETLLKGGFDLDPKGLVQAAITSGSLWTAQLEVGQTFHIQTQTAKYALTLNDPVTGLYDAVRVGPKKGGKTVEERFQMLFKGTFVPYDGLRHREFVPGGNLFYEKIRGGEVLEVSPSSTILRILFSIRESYQQAC